MNKMRNNLLILAAFVGFASCQSPNETQDQPTEESTPTKPALVSPPATELGKWRTESGTLYKYAIDGDTLYVMEGWSDRFPVSIHLK